MKEKIKKLIDEKNINELKNIINKTNVGDLAEVLSDLSNADLAKVFRIIPKDKAVDVFSEFDVVVATNLLRELSEKETVSLIDEMFADDATDLLFAKETDKIKDVCKKDLIYVSTFTDQEEVANMFHKYNLTVMPVVDSENRLVGIITIDDVLDVFESEATEDIKKMAAIIPVDKPYDKTGVFETYKARIPWLLLLMISATFTGKIIESFESALASVTILTAFIPMIMDTGGNAGGQASVSIIRALSLNDIEFKDIFKVIFKEFRVSILCALTLAICNFIKLLVVDAVSVKVAFCVCLTLIATVVLAKFIGCTLPMFAKKLGFDPAVMASPFITTIVDACSLMIYFNIATVLLGI